MAFIAAEEGLRLMAAAGLLAVTPTTIYYLYPLKAISAAFLLYRFRRQYVELSLRELTRDGRWVISCGLGIATCALWIGMDWSFSVTGAPAGFDPGLLPAGPVRAVLTSCRVAGAVLVVPLMEELFWRSFLMRYLVDSDFESVEVGRFTWGSFLIGAVLFGLEHHFVFAGIMAGAVYSLILYKTRSIAHCVLAHGVTNAALAAYVLVTGKWYFW